MILSDVKRALFVLGAAPLWCRLAWLPLAWLGLAWVGLFLSCGCALERPWFVSDRPFFYNVRFWLGGQAPVSEAPPKSALAIRFGLSLMLSERATASTTSSSRAGKKKVPCLQNLPAKSSACLKVLGTLDTRVAPDYYIQESIQ